MLLHLYCTPTESDRSHLCELQGARGPAGESGQQTGVGAAKCGAAEAEEADRDSAAAGRGRRRDRQRGKAPEKGEPEHELQSHAAVHAAAPRDHQEKRQCPRTGSDGEQDPEPDLRDAAAFEQIQRSRAQVPASGLFGHEPVDSHCSVGGAVPKSPPASPPHARSPAQGSATSTFTSTQQTLSASCPSQN